MWLERTMHGWRYILIKVILVKLIVSCSHFSTSYILFLQVFWKYDPTYSSTGNTKACLRNNAAGRIRLAPWALFIFNTEYFMVHRWMSSFITSKCFFFSFQLVLCLLLCIYFWKHQLSLKRTRSYSPLSSFPVQWIGPKSFLHFTNSFLQSILMGVVA